MPATQSRINDFVVKIGTVNGTGSASANGLLMKALFRMGIPVTGKNLFPSNIQGLPTWYEVRASHRGYMSRRSHVDVMVAMNIQTYQKDLAEVGSGKGPGHFVEFTHGVQSVDRRADQQADTAIENAVAGGLIRMADGIEKDAHVRLPAAHERFRRFVDHGVDNRAGPIPEQVGAGQPPAVCQLQFHG